LLNNCDLLKLADVPVGNNGTNDRRKVANHVETMEDFCGDVSTQTEEVLQV
jgi:hypothetical protein